MTEMRFRGVGVYGVGPGQIEKPGDFGYRIDGDKWQIALYCRKHGVCFQRIHTAPANEAAATWHWDGNIEQPTITPSIGCDSTPLRCGAHMTISKGVITT